jgi:hypothetical protein
MKFISFDGSTDPCDLTAMRDLANFKLRPASSANSDNHCVPREPPSKSRSWRIGEFNTLIKLQIPRSCLSWTYARMGPVTCSQKRMAQLEPISLDQMFSNKVHTDKFLICRTITQALFTTNMCVLVEDLAGGIEELTFHSCFAYDFTLEPDSLLPLNSILLIKEPLIGLYPCDGLKVDSPSDLVILSEIDRDHQAWKYLAHVPEQWLNDINPPKTFEELKKAGNESFVKKDFHQAVRMYTRALNSHSSELDSFAKKTLLSNRTVAFIRLEKYFKSYQDTRKADQIKESSPSLDEKVYFRMGEALFAMRQWEKALQAYEKCLEFNAKCTEAIERMERTKKRINETLTGNYDMRDVIDKAREHFVPRLDVADFVTNQIKIVPIKGDPNNLG